MRSLTEIRDANYEAEKREFLKLLNDIRTLESVLGIPRTDDFSQINDLSWEKLRKRHANLKAQVVYDPADDLPHLEPITGAQWASRSHRPLFR